VARPVGWIGPPPIEIELRSAVSLNVTLLATTPAGEVRTASQLREIVDATGFRRAEFRELPGAPGRVVIAYR
jgi:hypothetical protein